VSRAVLSSPGSWALEPAEGHQLRGVVLDGPRELLWVHAGLGLEENLQVSQGLQQGPGEYQSARGSPLWDSGQKPETLMVPGGVLSPQVAWEGPCIGQGQSLEMAAATAAGGHICGPMG
jgi:hypothetical protein